MPDRKTHPMTSSRPCCQDSAFAPAAREIADDLEAALEQFATIAQDLRR